MDAQFLGDLFGNGRMAIYTQRALRVLQRLVAALAFSFKLGVRRESGQRYRWLGLRAQIAGTEQLLAGNRKRHPNPQNQDDGEEQAAEGDKRQTLHN